MSEPAAELELVEGELPAVWVSTDPAVNFERYVGVSNLLARVIRERRLYAPIKGREHVLVEGWTLLGSLVGVFPATTWTRPVEGGYLARVEARDRAGSLVGAAEAVCLRTEARWRGADDYAVLSMAQTRATSKALRQPLGFVMQLAGFETTPADEMPTEPDYVEWREPDDPIEEPGVPDELPPPPMATRGQLSMLNAKYREAGLTDRDAKLAFATKILNRYIGSSKELTSGEASRLITALTSSEASTVALLERLSTPLAGPEDEPDPERVQAALVAVRRSHLYQLLEQRHLDGPQRLDLLTGILGYPVNEVNHLTMDELNRVIGRLEEETP